MIQLKTAIVTGASRGIGAATALMLSRLGYSVAVNYRENKAAADGTVKRITDAGGDAFSIRADVSDPEGVKELFRIAGAPDVLVNNAGISRIGLLQDMTDGEISRLIGTDLVGVILCSREAARLMVPKKSGCIINIASMWGEVGASCEAVYSAAKAGVIGFTKALAKELGPSGIRVNCVSPGVIKTDMNGELTRETLEELAGDTPLLRLGTPEDVAAAVGFLVREESSFITGQILPVNGGIVI